MGLTRRQWITAAGGAFAYPMYGLPAGEFWNRKDPGEWTSDEIAKLVTKSPWARESTAERVAMPSKASNDPILVPPTVRRNGTARRMPAPPAPAQNQKVFKGAIVWESAKPVRAARKTPLGNEFAGMYVISLARVPLIAKATPVLLERLRRASVLHIKGKDSLAPALVTQAAGGRIVFYFGFKRQMGEISKEDKEVTFITHRNNVEYSAKFNPREMLYRGELAD
jgi:hypothetical protein